MSAQPGTARNVDTLVIGAGQAGLALSYWLTHHGVEHVLLERRGTLGGAWLDRWDSFYLNTPNFGLSLPGMPYEGQDPDGFLPRDAAVEFFRKYGARIAAPVRLETAVTRVARDGTGFTVATDQGEWSARNVVLANGAFQRPRIPAAAREIPQQVLQLHSHDYRNPQQLPGGAVLVVGTGQSGGQITEDLMGAGREVHLSVSMCPEAPRRYRGQDVFHWILEVSLHGPEYGINGLMVDHLPSPAARFACNPLLSGNDGGHSIHLRELGRRGMQLHGHLETADGDGGLRFTDDLPERLAMVEAGFGQRLKVLADAYIAAAGINAPEPEAPPPDGWLPAASGSRLDLADADITSIIWATGYRLDNSILDMPVLDEWDYPRHTRGVTEVPGLYAVGLPWLTRHASATLPGVGPDAEFIAEHIAGGRAAG
ncbi:NAD(P)/FAD-dependent oxidoreductase [Pseudarthrobacter sp. H3Y2-7]|uniref:flavin-containing monooxygenase n=1 Tax=Pseudarthrobacter naphthalenicus TaxID=3031328 RepID=UPI0023AFC128|nr:NAD(P)/FAD-dependent oxidoreductase [Pseudarthrobacter sp. H3Y2-7]MDE8667631.1 NAD(P)/FAD-dependent oxidoreductase [Pseudarthrobacter sp. H3Y2-7]